MRATWSDLVSASVIGLYLHPWWRYAQSWNISDLAPFFGMMVTVLVNESLKHLVIGESSPRPPQARDCNLWVNDGPQGGRPGAPSGHSAQVAFFAAFALRDPWWSPVQRVALVVYALAVMASRWVKHCHTLGQIVSGAGLGTVMAVLVDRVLSRT
jgi:membrane-associated phospholipid phosphatase